MRQTEGEKMRKLKTEICSYSENDQRRPHTMEMATWRFQLNGIGMPRHHVCILYMFFFQFCYCSEYSQPTHTKNSSSYPNTHTHSCECTFPKNEHIAHTFVLVHWKTRNLQSHFSIHTSVLGVQLPQFYPIQNYYSTTF